MKFGQKFQNVVCHLLSKPVCQEKSRAQDNPLNRLENNRIKKTKGFWLRYEYKIYMILLLGESNGMTTDPYMLSD